MSIRLKAIDPKGEPFGDVFETSAGTIVVMTCREHASVNERNQAAESLRDAAPPNVLTLVLPHGYRVEVVEPQA